MGFNSNNNKKKESHGKLSTVLNFPIYIETFPMGMILKELQNAIRNRVD